MNHLARSKLLNAIGLCIWRPDLGIRFGRGSTPPDSLRQPAKGYGVKDTSETP